MGRALFGNQANQYVTIGSQHLRQARVAGQTVSANDLKEESRWRAVQQDPDYLRRQAEITANMLRREADAKLIGNMVVESRPEHETESDAISTLGNRAVMAVTALRTVLV